MTTTNALDAQREQARKIAEGIHAAWHCVKCRKDGQAELTEAIATALAQHALASEAAVLDYVAWGCYKHSGEKTWIALCDSDTPGAFKLYRHRQPGLAAQTSVLKQVGTGGAGDYPANEYSPAPQNDALAALKAEVRREEAQWWADEQVEKDGELSARAAIRLADIDAAAKGRPRTSSIAMNKMKPTELMAHEIDTAVPPAVTRYKE